MNDDFFRWLKRTFFDNWYMPLTVVAVMASLALVSSVYFYVRIQDLREQRITSTMKEDLRDCAVTNAAARQNQSQDRTLLNLLDAATDPDPNAFPIVASKEEDKLRARIGEGRQVRILAIDYLRPRDCYALPSQQPFEP